MLAVQYTEVLPPQSTSLFQADSDSSGRLEPQDPMDQAHWQDFVTNWLVTRDAYSLQQLARE